MSPRMSQNCALVLLLAMTAALAVGLMAWGPIVISATHHVFADQRSLGGVPNAFNALACLPLLAASLWGILATLRSAWPSTVRAPWLGFFSLAAANAIGSQAYHLAPGDLGYALSHLCSAGAFTLLLLGFLAERAEPVYGSRRAIVAALSIVAVAGVWWAAGQWSDGHGDLRFLLLLECLPILLIPTGALSLPGRFTSTTDWLAMLGLYTLARVADLADAALFSITGWISGHTLMHLLLAGVASCLAYRACIAPGSAPELADAVGEPTQRSTSLNTSS